MIEKFQGHDGTFASIMWNIFGHPMGAASCTWQTAHASITEAKMAKVYGDNQCSYREFHARYFD